MLKILYQETETKHGNDCLIKNCYVMLECHDIYIVMNIRRYRGWCDHGLDIRGLKQFENYFDAVRYYEHDLKEV